MSQNKLFIIFKDHQGGYARLMLDEILYVKSLGNYLKFFTVANHYVTHGSLQSLEEYLGSDPRFIRIHRSFLVNIEHVDHFSADGLKLKEHQIPISGKSFELLRNTFIADRLFKA